MDRNRAPRPDDDVQIVLKNRDRLEGTFVGETPTQYIVRIERVDLRVDKATVERLVVLAPPKERYRQMRAVIDDEDVERLIVLTRWLLQHELFEDASREIEAVISVAPNNSEALRLRTVVNELAELDRRRSNDNESRPGMPSDSLPDETGVDSAAWTGFPLLSADQINLMKVFEIDLDDPPRILISRSVIERLLQDYSSDPLIPSTREGREAFYRFDPAKILDTMFRVRARELYGQVVVVGHPESMRRFRDQVHSAWLVNSCATSRCHGGRQAGQLILTNRRPTSAESVYTNFLILEQFRTKDGHALIDYENPEQSLLLQYGLPADDSIEAHPEVPGWAPVFRSRSSRGYRNAEGWIRSMYRPRPDYPIEYEPPGRRDPEPPVER